MRLTDYPELVAQWDYEGNGELNPGDFAPYSRTKVQWMCEQGHKWSATIEQRTVGHNCPFCAGQRVWPGFNDLLTLAPTIAAEWSYDRNKELTPQMVTVSSGRRVWWVCAKGHEWQTSVSHRTGGRGCPFCSGKKAWPGYNDLATLIPNIAVEWNAEKNGDLTPDKVTIYSHKKVWWVCALGHEWEAYIYNRTAGCGCPVCGGKKILVGFNDLASNNPYLASEWNTEKNGELSPQCIAPFTPKKVWWKCARGHEWLASVESRNKGGHGCPYCARQKTISDTDGLSANKRKLKEEWHTIRNENLSFESAIKHSDIMVWWKCKYGHEWEESIRSRVGGGKCPYCIRKRAESGINDLATLNPELAAEWHVEKNGGLRASDVRVHSAKKVWWKCVNGHEWVATILSRSDGNGCPYCAGQKVLVGVNDLATKNPRLAKEWHPTKNRGLHPEDVTDYSQKNVWWCCPNGHEWRTSVCNRNTGTGCPKCKRTNHKRLARPK